MDTMWHVRTLARIWRDLADDTDEARGQLAAAVREAKQAGHSYQELADAVGGSIGMIQRMLR